MHDGGSYELIYSGAGGGHRLDDGSIPTKGASKMIFPTREEQRRRGSYSVVIVGESEGRRPWAYKVLATWP